ncbi:MAG: DUF2505 family protein [Acidimicrobiales bacterium]
MRFEAAHRIPAPRAAVAPVLADPSFYAGLELPDLSLPEVVEHVAGELVVLRYEFTGHLDPIVLRLLGTARRLTWTQELRLDGDSGGTLTFRADAGPSTLHGDARFTLTEEKEPSGETGPGVVSTVRTMEGTLVVAVPVIGAMAERRIVPGVLARLDVEADALAERLRT